MTSNERPIFRFMVLTAILTVVALWVLGFGVHLLLKGGASILGGAALGFAGACVLLVTIRDAVGVFRGKAVVEQVISLPLPGSAACEMTIPTPMKRGRVIVFFQETTERYAGKVTLTKVPSDGASPVSATLLRIVPSRIKAPKWSPSSAAGEAVENWPRGTGSAAKPVMLEFTFPVHCQDKLKLEFDLESNFSGTMLERRFPLTGKETIRVIVRE